MAHELEMSGWLTLKLGNQITLKDLEEFLAEARQLGLPDNAQIYTTRQSFLGPISSFSFKIPVEPKTPNA